VGGVSLRKDVNGGESQIRGLRETISADCNVFRAKKAEEAMSKYRARSKGV
jgi:hypothetical protein